MLQDLFKETLKVYKFVFLSGLLNFSYKMQCDEMLCNC